MSLAGRPTGLAVCLAGVTSVTTATPSTSSSYSSYCVSSPPASAPPPSSRCFLPWRQVLRQGQFTLLRTHSPYLRVLQTAATVVAISSCSYSYLSSPSSPSSSSSSSSSSFSSSSSSSVEPRHSNTPQAARLSSSFPHLSSLRSNICSFPALMAVANQTRAGHGAGNSGVDKSTTKSTKASSALDSKSQSHTHTPSHSHDHGHSHSPLHHHHHDNAYLTSSEKSDPGVRITRIGLLSNLGMAIAKFAGGWAFNSKALTADAWHSMTDLASDILTLATVSWSLKPPTDKFPMGFGKVESLGALGVSGMLLLGGMYMGWESGISVYAHFYPESAHGIIDHVGHGHSHSHLPSALGIPSMHAAWLAAGTILIKEWLYHATMKVARERKSSVLASNAIHHRVDSLTGFVTLAAIMGANAVENAAWLDPVGGLLISFMVIHAGWGNSMEAFYELADRAIDDEVKASVTKQAQKALAKIENHHEMELLDVSGIKSGQNFLLDLEISVPGTWTVETVRQVEEAVRTRVGAKVRGARKIRIRFTPKEVGIDPRYDDFIPASMNPKLEEDVDSTDDETDKHSHSHGEGHNHKH